MDFKKLILDSCNAVEVDCGKYGKFFIRTLSAAETLSLTKIEEGDEFIREKIVAKILADADGVRVFADTEYQWIHEHIANPLINLLTGHYQKISAISDSSVVESKKN